MLPRLLIWLLAIAVVGGAGYGVSRLVAGRTPKPLAVAVAEATDPRKAQVLLRTAVRQDPRNAQAHVMLAQTQLDLGDPIAAERELKTAQTLRFDRAVIGPLLARAYLDQDRFQDVLIEFSALEVSLPIRLANLKARSTAYTALGDLARARSTIAAAAEIAPSDPTVLIGQARVALAADELGAARTQSDRVLAVAPALVEGWLLQADVLGRQGDGAAARAALDRAVSLAPYSPVVRHQRALLLIGQRDLKAAQADIDAGLLIDPPDPALHLDAVAVMTFSGRVADAELQLQHMAEGFDKMPRGFFYLAVASAGMNHNSQALDAVYRFLKVQPKDKEAVQLAAELELRMGRPQRAIENVNRLGPVRDAGLADVLGRGYFLAGQTADAIQSFLAATALDPGNKEFAAHLAAARALWSRPPSP